MHLNILAFQTYPKINVIFRYTILSLELLMFLNLLAQLKLYSMVRLPWCFDMRKTRSWQILVDMAIRPYSKASNYCANKCCFRVFHTKIVHVLCVIASLVYVLWYISVLVACLHV